MVIAEHNDLNKEEYQEVLLGYDIDLISTQINAFEIIFNQAYKQTQITHLQGRIYGRFVSKS